MLITKNTPMSPCKCICSIKEDMWYFFVTALLNNFNGLETCILYNNFMNKYPAHWTCMSLYKREYTNIKLSLRVAIFI